MKTLRQARADLEGYGVVNDGRSDEVGGGESGVWQFGDQIETKVRIVVNLLVTKSDSLMALIT